MNPTETVDCVVIGAGVVGLATARALAFAGREVLVLERHGLIGSETSSRNSEVIHAGIYYPSGSLKARLCVRGKALLYAYCATHGVPHRRCGKLIVATSPEQSGILQGYQRQARMNGVGELHWLDEAGIEALEPAVDGHCAVFSPTTGIIDSHAYMVALQGDLEASGGVVALDTPVGALQVDNKDTVRVSTPGLDLLPRTVINAAGLSAPLLAANIGEAPSAFYARGRYYTLSGRSPFSHLVYPVAEAGGLGVHVTLDLGGQARFGPDVAWIEDVDYEFDDGNRAAFVKAIRRYYPALDEDRLQPGYTGIRPKISGPGAPAADFRIERPHPGFINLLGIESPGLTASLAIAELVAAMAAP